MEGVAVVEREGVRELLAATVVVAVGVAVGVRLGVGDGDAVLEAVVVPTVAAAHCSVVLLYLSGVAQTATAASGVQRSPSDGAGHHASTAPPHAAVLKTPGTAALRTPPPLEATVKTEPGAQAPAAAGRHRSPDALQRDAPAHDAAMGKLAEKEGALKAARKKVKRIF